ncbi:cortical protein marker for cell polarity-domain-containing protein [Phellopilus nigrolimitatus]|nr:cortical protein marker for cell polarity-domain-containing protein [Phellopilus nigrolimitatus]
MTKPSRCWRTSSTFVFFLSLLLQSLVFVSAALPKVNFDVMGHVGLAGTFAGLDLFDNSTSLSFDPTTSTLLSRAADGSLSRLGSTEAGGKINTGCALGGTIYFAGSFTSINGSSASNVASYSSSQASFDALGSGGPNGEIKSIFCDASNNKVWVGGSFSSPGKAVAVWDTSANSWSAPPFSGLSGATTEVLSITTNSSAKSLFFAGSFITAFGSNSSTVINGTNNPNVPFSSGATPFSSSLVPIPLQGAQINASPSTSDSQFSNISNVLCPSGSDGPGSTWLAADGFQAVITVREFAQLSANGIRLGNTFQSNHGTTGFSVTSIPDNVVQTLSYVDPTTGTNQTCSGTCPLLTDSSIPYQDFLFASDVQLTGFQLTFSSRRELLHLQLPSQNGISCFAPSASNISLVGQWTEKDVSTNIAGTVQDILATSVNVGTSSANSPSITWMPYVSASGNYNDCDARTSVKVTVFPGGGVDPQVTTVSQRVSDDTTQLIYSGPVTPTSPSFVATIIMTLADNPEGSGQNGQYELVADRVELSLTSVFSNSSSNGTSTTNNSTSTRQGFGFFEWPLSDSSTVNAASALSNASETSLDDVAFQLFNAIGSGSVSSTSDVVAANGALASISEGGLNGPVTSLVLDGDILYVGGAFTDTKSASTSGKARGVVSYDVNADSWTPLQAVEVTGDFTEVPTSAGGSSGATAGGFAVWDVNNSTWANTGGFLIGSMTFVGNSTGQTQILAGNVVSSLKFGASGFVTLQNGNDDDGVPVVSTLNIQLQDNSNDSVQTTSTKRKRSATPTNGWLSLANLFKRQSAIPEPLPADPVAPAPAVLAGAFWTNSSDTQERVILGGNFSFPTSSSSESSGVALYDLSTGSVEALAGNPINGTVRSLLVAGSSLFIGGDFTVSGSSVVGLAIYDLNEQALDMSGLDSLQGSSGSSVIVRSLTTSSSKSNTIIVAGSFSSAGSVSCAGICQLDVTSKQWSALGSGINGEVASVAYGGDDQELLFASGSIALTNGTAANVAMFAFDNTTWTAVGNSSDLPGLVTALTVDDGNSSSIFAAGKSSDASSPFLAFWNGVSWTSIDSGFESATNIAQLILVPLQDQHSANAMIEQDRMLLVSGSLVSSSFGNASSALFDGQTFFPYITTSTAQGSAGMVSSLFSSIQNFSFSQRHFLAVGVVILISIAIAAGVVFFLVLLGILWTLFARRDNNKVDYAAYEEDDDSIHQRPSSLLEHINAATRTTIIGTSSPFENQNAQGEEENLTGGMTADPFAGQEDHDGDNFRRAETPSEAMGALGMAMDEQGRSAHARYSFDGGGEGELKLDEGMSLEVLDDRDPNWWYARDVNSGREGVVPAAYVEGFLHATWPWHYVIPHFHFPSDFIFVYVA